MQRLFTLLLVFLISLSCSRDIEFNTSSFQGTINYELWDSNNFHSVLLDNGGIRIAAKNRGQTLILSIESLEEGNYILNSTSLSSAVFEDENSKIYATSASGDGEIVIESYDPENFTITGTYKFNAYSLNGELVNFIDGIFYKIPFSSNSESGELAVSNTFRASVNEVTMEAENIQTDLLDGQILISANQIDNTTIEFFIPENIQLGSYTLNSSTQIYANYIFADGSFISSQYGTLTILEHDQQFKKIKASFLFNTGHPYNIQVTNGNFIVYY